MKCDSEQRGVQSQFIYDALLDQFLQRVLKHDFETVTQSNKKQSESAEIVELPQHEAAVVDKSSSRKSRTTAMMQVQKRHAG